MSKSKGEFLTVSLLRERGFEPAVYRFFCLQSHYRKALTFSWDNLENAKTAYEKLITRIAGAIHGAQGQPDQTAMEPFRGKFREALDNDLNTSLALTALYDVLKSPLSGADKRALIGEFDQVLGLELLERADRKKVVELGPIHSEIGLGAAAEAETWPAEAVRLMEERTKAKTEKNWPEADRLREQLREMGYEVVDTPNGPRLKER